MLRLAARSATFKALRHSPSAAVFRAFSTYPAPVADENVFYHIFDPPTPLSSQAPAFAVSFLETRPSTPESATIAGWLPIDSNAGLNDFQPNSKFRQVLDQALKEGLEKDLDDIWRNSALQLNSGWMHIHDDRKMPDMNRIGDPDDILGTVLVENGKIKAETWQSMPAYRICTSDGLTQLTPGMKAHLHKTLERMNNQGE